MSKDLSAIAHGIGVPVLVGLERGAWYGSRSIFVLWVMRAVDDGGLGMSTSDATALTGRIGMLAVVAPLAGGLLGVATGPYPPMVLGALLCVAGYAGLAAGAGLWAPMGLVLLGSGLIKPCVWASLAETLHAPRAWLRAAAFVGAYAAIQVAALVGSTVAPLLGAAILHWVCAAAVAGVAPLAIGLWLAARRAPEVPVSLEAAGIAVGVGFAVAVCAAPFSLLLGVGGLAQFDAAQQVGLGSTGYSVLFGVGPVLSLVSGLVVGAVLVGAHVSELRWPPLLLAGVGMVGAALGVVALLPDAVGVAGIAALGVGAAGLSLSEAAVLPIVMARIGGDGHWRVTPLLMGLWLIASGFAASAGNSLPALLGTTPSLVGAAALCGFGGVALIAGGALGRELLMGSPAESDPG